MKDPINLSIGLPDFDVPDPAKQAAVDAIWAGHNRYTPTQGIEPLRRKLREKLEPEIGGFAARGWDVIVTGGVAYFIPWLPDQASTQAEDIDQVYWFVAIICAIICATCVS